MGLRFVAIDVEVSLDLWQGRKAETIRFKMETYAVRYW